MKTQFDSAKVIRAACFLWAVIFESNQVFGQSCPVLPPPTCLGTAPQKPSNVFFDGGSNSHFAETIIARDIEIAGWLTDLGPNCDAPDKVARCQNDRCCLCEDFHYGLVLDPDYILNAKLNQTLSSLAGKLQNGNGAVAALIDGSIVDAFLGIRSVDIFFKLVAVHPTTPLPFEDLEPGGATQKPCWERDPNAADPNLRPCRSRGITMNSFLLPGNIGTYQRESWRRLCTDQHSGDQGKIEDCYEKNVQRMDFHPELNAWIWSHRGCPPIGWVREPTDTSQGLYFDGFWVFDPRWPDKSQNPNLNESLKPGDYVVMRGTLWQDGAHFPEGSWLCKFLGGATCTFSNLVSRDADLEQVHTWEQGHLFGHGGWLEMHPPDSIRRTPPRALAACKRLSRALPSLLLRNCLIRLAAST